jgi:hypothetical protein
MYLFIFARFLALLLPISLVFNEQFLLSIFASKILFPNLTPLDCSMRLLRQILIENCLTSNGTSIWGSCCSSTKEELQVEDFVQPIETPRKDTPTKIPRLSYHGLCKDPTSKRLTGSSKKSSTTHNDPEPDLSLSYGSERKVSTSSISASIITLPDPSFATEELVRVRAAEYSPC